VLGFDKRDRFIGGCGCYGEEDEEGVRVSLLTLLAHLGKLSADIIRRVDLEGYVLDAILPVPLVVESSKERTRTKDSAPQNRNNQRKRQPSHVEDDSKLAGEVCVCSGCVVEDRTALKS
jgi:hypothetical protein